MSEVIKIKDAIDFKRSAFTIKCDKEKPDLKKFLRSMKKRKLKENIENT